MAATRLFPGVALVTGAAGTGIGAAVAKAFASAGCERIAITDVNETQLLQTRAAIESAHPNTRVLSQAGNITDSNFIDAFMASLRTQFGRVDYAVNCAGVLGDNKRSTETTLEQFDHVNNVNYRGCWLSSRAQLRLMLQQDPLPSHDPDRPVQRGSIVNIASQLGIVGRPTAPSYCGSKAAVIAMTRSDAIDYSADHIRVNCICPGVIETPMTTHSEEIIARLRPAIDIAPMKRMGKASEVADAALFLCSTQASFVQGHAMVVDGGYVIN
ncbi:oxidoreductase-7 [Coleophoma cylindrospora]|uniref:Oxidoreductase-7 n=1 Tax=Coleophoma cylindrospora TaxID=1849047 RepID=A0A3D8RG24_9HELO|nr:oxidoreductase-7 [Coleophoma cylindrospora]